MSLVSLSLIVLITWGREDTVVKKAAIKPIDVTSSILSLFYLNFISFGVDKFIIS